MTTLLKIASALETLADEWDRQPVPEPAAATPDPLLAALATELGEQFDPATAQKVAEDPSARALLESLVKQAAVAHTTPRPLGSAVEKISASVRRTREEEYADALNHFGAVIMGNR